MSQDITVDLIDPNPDQPRKVFDPAAIAELSSSIAEVGLISPISVRAVGRRFMIVVGERRYRAAASLGWKTIPAEVLDVDEKRAWLIALHENIQRQDLTPIEEAKAYQLALSDGGTQQSLADELGVNQGTVAQKLRLLSLPESLQDFLNRRVLTESHTRQLLRLRKIYGGLEVEIQCEGCERLTAPDEWSKGDIFMFLNGCRPEDVTAWAPFGAAEKAETKLILSEACAAFMRGVFEANGKAAQWERAGLWWAALAVDCGVGVADLSMYIDRWQERFRSAYLWALTYGDPAKNFRPQRGDADQPASWEYRVGLNALSDLRHSGVYDVRAWITHLPECFLKYSSLDEEDAPLALPSAHQAWSPCAEELASLWSAEHPDI